MEDLRSTDLRAVLDVGHDLHDVPRMADFPLAAVEGAERLIGADTPSYNEVDLSTRSVVAVAPRRALFPGAEELAGRFVHQNPAVAHYARTGDGRACKLSDFVTQRKLHRLDMYDLVYRNVGVEHLMAIVLPAGRGERSAETQVRVSLGRTSPDFTERDRQVLNTLRPFLAQAKRSLEEVEELRDTMRDLEQATLTSTRMVIVLTPSGHIRDATQPAAALVRGLGGRASGELPEPLRSWVRSARADMAVAARRFVFDGPKVQLAARLLRGRADDEAVVLIAAAGEQATAEAPLGRASSPQRSGRTSTHPDRDMPQTLRMPDVEWRQTLGLTRRQAEVLRLASLGKSTTAIARELFISTSTVRKHLENVYARLGVSSRGAAVARALSAR